MGVAILLTTFFGILLLGAPIAVALGGSVLLTSFAVMPLNPAIIGQKLVSNLNDFALMAVPFFFFTAAFMESGGLVNRLLALANSLVGHFRGGLAMATVLTCVFFASISGSSPATVAAVGSILYPSLVDEGYSKEYAIGAIVTGGSIGILMPPSIPLILYGFVTQTSIPALFIAGIIPAVIYGGSMLCMARFLAVKANFATKPVASYRNRFNALLASSPALTLPLLIVVGIYGFPQFSVLGFHYGGGAIFTPTEASVVAMGAAILIGLFVYRELPLRSIPQTIIKTSPKVGMIFWIATNALLFGYFITRLGVPEMITHFVLSLHLDKWEFLFLVNIIFVIIGFFLEGVPSILIFVPLLFPAAKAIGVDPIHFGVIIVCNIELGLVTPPVGLNLFVGSTISDLSVFSVFRAALPWMLVTVANLILITYVPILSLFLPGLMH